MASSDPLGDMIAMIKNANTRGLKRVSLCHSRLKEGVAKVLKSEGFLDDYRVVEDEKKLAKNKALHLFLRLDPQRGPVIHEIRRVSKPGCRIFRGVDDLGKVLDGLGICVLSTSQGILSDRAARRNRTGGEVLCKVW